LHGSETRTVRTRTVDATASQHSTPGTTTVTPAAKTTLFRHACKQTTTMAIHDSEKLLCRKTSDGQESVQFNPKPTDSKHELMSAPIELPTSSNFPDSSRNLHRTDYIQECRSARMHQHFGYANDTKTLFKSKSTRCNPGSAQELKLPRTVSA